MLKRVREYILQHQLLDKTKLHLVALSGGADSVCLLLVLKELGYEVHAVHCNFMLRGEESTRDEQFCKQLCEEQRVPLHFTHFDTRTYAELHKVSIEMAARELRYAYFEQLRVAINAEDIVVAHHRDDNVETFLMNILRGTGIHGLQAIKPCNEKIIRPLLCIGRIDIETFLTQRNQMYVTDSSNLIDDVIRNKIRLNLIPLMETINPAAKENICRTIANVNEAASIIDWHTENAMCEAVREEILSPFTATKTIFIDKQKLIHQPSAEHLLFAILSKYGFASSQIKQIYQNINATSGKTWISSTHILATDRQNLLVEPMSDDDVKEMKMPETGNYIYNVRAKESSEKSMRQEYVKVKLKVSIERKNDDFQPSRQPYCVTLDADKVEFPLYLRRVGEGDRFHPYGLKGTKLVSDYLTDRKCNYFQRRRQLVLTDTKGEIIWLVGERASQCVACSKSTEHILRIEMTSECTHKS